MLSQKEISVAHGECSQRTYGFGDKELILIDASPGQHLEITRKHQNQIQHPHGFAAIIPGRLGIRWHCNPQTLYLECETSSHCLELDRC